jgi:fructuronate reductase
MKLRCLNGTHSALAYLGYLAGYQTVFEAVSDDDFAKFIDKLWMEEIIPTLPQLDGIDLTAYCADLKKRYRNPEIRHLTWQIAMDGSQKIPQRILGTIRDNLGSDASTSGLALVVAAWMRYVGAVDELGNTIDVKDPLAQELQTISQSHEVPEDKVKALLAFRAVFDEDLANDIRFSSAVTKAYFSLIKMGSKQTVKAHL